MQVVSDAFFKYGGMWDEEKKKRQFADDDNLAVSSANEPCYKRNARNGGMQFPLQNRENLHAFYARPKSIQAALCQQIDLSNGAMATSDTRDTRKPHHMRLPTFLDVMRSTLPEICLVENQSCDQDWLGKLARNATVAQSATVRR